MRLRRKLKAFLAIAAADRWLILEAALLLAILRLVILVVPLRFQAPFLARAPETANCDEAVLQRVRRAVTTAARNVPWNAVCLPQAMTAKVMLALRGCGSAVHLGAGTDNQGKLVAHAWLVAGGKVVVGADGIAGVTPLARFG